MNRNRRTSDYWGLPIVTSWGIVRQPPSKQADTVFLAPEVDIKCATHNSSIGEHEDTSTSFC